MKKRRKTRIKTRKTQKTQKTQHKPRRKAGTLRQPGKKADEQGSATLTYVARFRKDGISTGETGRKAPEKKKRRILSQASYLKRSQVGVGVAGAPLEVSVLRWTPQSSITENT